MVIEKNMLDTACKVKIEPAKNSKLHYFSLVLSNKKKSNKFPIHFYLKLRISITRNTPRNSE